MFARSRKARRVKTTDILAAATLCRCPTTEAIAGLFRKARRARLSHPRFPPRHAQGIHLDPWRPARRRRWVWSRSSSYSRSSGGKMHLISSTRSPHPLSAVPAGMLAAAPRTGRQIETADRQLLRETAHLITSKNGAFALLALVQAVSSPGFRTTERSRAFRSCLALRRRELQQLQERSRHDLKRNHGLAGRKTSARTSMLSRGSALRGVVGSSKAVCAVKRLLDLSSESKHLIRSASSRRI